jgi:hypothetical protein
MLPALILSTILNMFPPYNRDLYGDWIDADGDCQNTRQEVLIEESLIPVELDSRGCRVQSPHIGPPGSKNIEKLLKGFRASDSSEESVLGSGGRSGGSPVSRQRKWDR